VQVLLIDIGLIVFSGAMVIIGALMVAAPTRLIDIGQKLGRLLGVEVVNLEWQARGTVQWRIAGVIAMVLALLMGTSAAVHLISGTGASAPYASAKPVGTNWPALVIGVLAAGIGSLLLWRPGSVLAWFDARAGFRTTSPPAGRGQQLLARAVGMFFLLGSFSTLLLWFKSLH